MGLEIKLARMIDLWSNLIMIEVTSHLQEFLSNKIETIQAHHLHMMNFNRLVTLLSNMNDTQSSDKWYLNENLCNVSSMFKIIRRQQHKNLAIPQTKLVPKDLKMPFILKRQFFNKTSICHGYQQDKMPNTFEIYFCWNQFSAIANCMLCSY
jgi:hypothetical protein